jgi:hypothetical protein
MPPRRKSSANLREIECDSNGKGTGSRNRRHGSRRTAAWLAWSLAGLSPYIYSPVPLHDALIRPLSHQLNHAPKVEEQHSYYLCTVVEDDKDRV